MGTPKTEHSACEILGRIYDDYEKTTPTNIKLIDAYLAFVVATGVIQFAYLCIAGSFPFNAFISGFISCVGSFTIGACLRIQTNPDNKDQFQQNSPTLMLVGFLLAHLVLHLCVFNFIGGVILRQSW